MRKKIIHKRKGIWRWPSSPLCNVAGDCWKIRCDSCWIDVTCKRCLKMKEEKPVDQSKIVKFRTGCSASGG